jgi:hypothetical protein
MGRGEHASEFRATIAPAFPVTLAAQELSCRRHAAIDPGPALARVSNVQTLTNSGPTVGAADLIEVAQLMLAVDSIVVNVFLPSALRAL